MLRSIVMAGFMGTACLTANAAVVVNLDNAIVSEVGAIRYHAGVGILELVLIDNLACQGSTSVWPLPEIGLVIGGQLYELDGPIAMDFSAGQATLSINSAPGNLDCNSDRIFSDRLAEI